MPEVVADNHRLSGTWQACPAVGKRGRSPRFSDGRRERIHVPSICVVELTYLVEKGRLPVAARDWLLHALDDPAAPFLLAPWIVQSPTPSGW